MSVNSVLTALADAIRSKTGGTGTLTLEQMAAAVNSIETGSKTTFATAKATPSGNSLSISFTGLTGQPDIFSVAPLAQIQLGTSTRYVLNVMYDGESTHGSYGYGSGSMYSTKYYNTYTATGYTWKYEDGTLTITATDATDGGYFMIGVEYQLTYTTGAEVASDKLVAKTGTTTSNAIDTGLSSVEYFYMKKASTPTSKGLVIVMYADGKSEGAVRTSDSSASYSTFSNNTQYASVDGGTFTWNGSSYYAMITGEEYKWIAFGTE